MPDQPDLLFLLYDIARLLRVSGDRRARAHGMTRAQWVILWQLQRQPGLSQKELADFMEVEPISVARLVDRLASRGMVERRDDPADRRIWRLHLLPPAYPVLDHMRGERDSVAHLLATGLAPQALETVRQSLIAMKTNVLAELRARTPDLPAPVLPEPPGPSVAPAIRTKRAKPQVAAPQVAKPPPAKPQAAKPAPSKPASRVSPPSRPRSRIVPAEPGLQQERS